MTAKSKPSNAFKIDVDMVKHVALLVRLGISEEEARAFSQQFTSIIDYFQLLNELETADVPPATQITQAGDAQRQDEVTPSMSREEFLANVPQRKGDFVKVPLVLGDE